MFLYLIQPIIQQATALVARFAFESNKLYSFYYARSLNHTAIQQRRKKKRPKFKSKPRSQPTAKSRSAPRSESPQTILRPAPSTPVPTIVAPPAPTAPIAAEPELTIDVTGERRIDLPKSSPIYTMDSQQIDRQGAKNVAYALKNLPSFAINDVGYGADIHTGTYYRGASVNQFIISLNGRPINTNVNTYHGATDLNSIPAEAIERSELSSGASNIIYGSESFGGVVNIIKKAYKSTPETNVSAELGSYGRQDYRASYIGGDRKLNYRIGVENIGSIIIIVSLLVPQTATL